VVAADVAGIDVNSGCPKPFSTLGGMGAALLKEPDRLCSILEALVKEIVPEFQIGISVKIRILDDPKDTEALVRRLVATGITGLTVHCRTTPMRPRERAIRDQLHMIADICREAGVACLMNGDVTNYDEAIALAQEYRCDGGMIATAAEQNPTVFLNAENGGPLPRGHLVREYLETAISVNNKWGNTKFCLAQLMPTKDKRGPFLSRSRCHEDVVKALGFDDMLDLARETDTRYGLTLNGKANRKHKGGQKQAQQQTKTKTKDGPPATNGTHESNGVKRSEPERSPERATHTPKKMRLEDVVEQPMANTAQQAMSV
jgi:tRNA-dihydrouridine synthase 2